MCEPLVGLLKYKQQLLTDAHSKNKRTCATVAPHHNQKQMLGRKDWMCYKNPRGSLNLLLNDVIEYVSIE